MFRLHILATPNAMSCRTLPRSQPIIVQRRLRDMRCNAWTVHKFGSECLGSPIDMRNASDIILTHVSDVNNPVELPSQLVIVNAIDSVTDMLDDTITKAINRDMQWVHYMKAVRYKHEAYAKYLLGNSEEYDAFNAQLTHDTRNLYDILQAIHTARCSTGFVEIVLSYGEIWSAALLRLACMQQRHPDIQATYPLYNRRDVRAVVLDTRDIMIVNSNKNNKLSLDCALSRSHVDKWLQVLNVATKPPNVIIATALLCKTHTGGVKRERSALWDANAAHLAAMFDCSSITIWTDENGIHSAPLTEVENAFSLRTATLNEVQALSYFRHDYSAYNLVPDVGVTVHVRNMLNLFEHGTLIMSDSGDIFSSTRRLTGFATTGNITYAMVQCTNAHGIRNLTNRAITAVEGAGVKIVLLCSGCSDFTVSIVINSTDDSKTLEALQACFNTTDSPVNSPVNRPVNIYMIDNCALLTAVQPCSSPRDPSYPNIFKRVDTEIVTHILDTLTANKCNVKGVCQGYIYSSNYLSIVLDKDDIETALREVHKECIEYF